MEPQHTVEVDLADVLPGGIEPEHFGFYLETAL